MVNYIGVLEMNRQIGVVLHTYKVGDDVSYGFNGDWRHCGKVTKITKKFLHTDCGYKFTLYVKDVWQPLADSDRWADLPTQVFKMTGSPSWTLTKGIVEERNPHF
jgi:hypothetical protein